MARATTSDELDLLADPAGYQIHTTIEIEDPDGEMRDYTSQSGMNWQYSFKIEADIDQPVAQATVQLRREIGALSLAPLRSDSTLNRDGSGNVAPAIDIGRRMQIQTAVVPLGGTPSADDWKFMFDGIIDDLASEGPLIQVTARDDGGLLVDTRFEASQSLKYADPGKAIEDVIRDILGQTQYVSDPDNPLVITLNVPTSPGFQVTKFGYTITDSVMDAIQRLVQVIGWNLRYQHDDVSNTFVLTLSDPGRGKTTPDFTLAVNQLIKINELKLDRASVRNHVTVITGGEATPVLHGLLDNASILRYGYRRIVIREDSDSPANPSLLAQYVLADLKDPKTSHNADLPYFWPVDLNDLIRFTANHQQYDTDLDLAVVGYTHSVSSEAARTTLLTRGTPASGYLTWRARAQLGRPIDEIARRNLASVNAVGDSDDGRFRNFLVVAGTDVDMVHVHWRTVPVNATGDPYDFADDSTFVDTTDGDPHLLILAPSNNRVTFQLPVPPRDYRTYARIVPYAKFIEGDSYKMQPLEPSTSVQSSIIAGPSSANNGQTTTVSATFDTDTAIGAACARYSLDGGANWTTVTVPSTRAIAFNVTRTSSKQTVIVQGKNDVDGNWGDQGTCEIDAYIADGPSLWAVYVPIDSTSGKIVWSCDVGTVDLEIDDSGTRSTPAASPIPITLDSATHGYLFRASNADQETAVNVFVPALPATSGPPPLITSFFSTSNGRNFSQNTTTNEIDLDGSVSNPPSGYTLDLEWSLDGGATTRITGISLPYHHNDTGTGGHGLDLVNGGTFGVMRYTLYLMDGATEVAASAIECEVDYT